MPLKVHYDIVLSMTILAPLAELVGKTGLSDAFALPLFNSKLG